jgi:hypothetical protein
MVKPPDKKTFASSLGVDPETQKVFDLYFSTKEGKENSWLLNDQTFRVGTEIVSSRVMSHWELNGLLTVVRQNSEWRKFSIMDMLWLYIMTQLRESYEVSLDKLKTIKVSLEDKKESYGVAMPLLEVYTMLALTKGKDVVLVIFPDCSAKPFLNKYVHELLKDFGMNNFMVLNLNKILERVMPKYKWVREQLK